MKKPENQLLVIFGASGDLAHRKLLPAIFELFRQHLLPERYAIIGAGRTEFTDESFRQKTRESITGSKPSDKEITDFLALVHYVTIDTSDVSDYKKLKERICEINESYNTGDNYVFYLATPPGLYHTISENLAAQGLNKNHNGSWRRIIIEKPFGYDQQSASELNRLLYNYFSEDQLYRIDHYLGKETVQNVMVTRFSNGIFEPLWNRNYVHHIEITSAENIGVENRGNYYDQIGAMRDMVQNHLLHLLTLVAMEPPTVITSTAIRNEMLKVLQAVRPIQPEDVKKNVVRGQYTASTLHGIRIPAYREEKGINPASFTETFVGLKLFVDNWRWGGVPFYIRTGKRLPTKVTEIVVHFKPTPHKLFCFYESSCNSDNQLVLRIQPDEGILLKFGMKVPGSGFNVQDVNMDFHYSELAQAYIPEAYQRLLLDCMQGDSTLFIRGDAIETAWGIVDPVIKTWKENPEIPLYGYPAGTWGPVEAENLIEGEGMSWRYPCKNLTSDGIYCEL
jgi:glucose-6-phosphate 1-dehydrogenase